MSPPPETPVEDPARPLRRDAERNRRRILEAAAELFADRGLGVTLDDVARHAGVGVGTVYRRFPNKPALVDALFEERMERVCAIAREGLEHPDPWEGLVGTLRRMLDMQSKDRALKELLVGERRHGERFERNRDDIERTMAALVGRAKDAGVVREDLEATDVPLTVLMLTTALDASRPAAGPVWERMFAIVLDGLRARGPGATPLPLPVLAPHEVELAFRSASRR